MSQVQVVGDSDLVASNIKQGINVFGITGTLIVPYQVKNITTKGTYDNSSYHGDYWASIDSNGNLIVVVTGGINTSFESIYFPSFNAPNGVTQIGQSYYSYASMSANMLYCTVFSGITSDVNIILDFNSRDSASDVVACTITIESV